MTRMDKPFLKLEALRSGVFVFGLAVAVCQGTVAAEDGGGKSRDLQAYAEEAIATEQANGNTELASAMQELLPEMLEQARLGQTDMQAGTNEELASHDPKIRRGLLDLADHMDARLSAANNSRSQAGSFTLFVRSDGVNLTLTSSESLQAITDSTTVTVNPGVSTTVTSPGDSNNSTVGFSGSPGNSGGGGGPPEGRGRR